MLKMYWFPGMNFGDAINPYLIDRVFQVPVKWAPRSRADFCGIGSILQGFSKYKTRGPIIKMFHAPLTIWSSGFIGAPKTKERFFRKIEVSAVRGIYSKQRLEILLKRPVDCPLGDGGLLLSHLLEKQPEKKYALGIVPHVSDFTNPLLQQIKDSIKHSVIIDMSARPLQVLKQLAECETIISSALHGLVTADSLGIPNKWIEVSDHVEGAGYKFRDYYSAFGITDVQPLRLSAPYHVPDDFIRAITDTYAIDAKQVQQIQQNLINAFPFK